MEVLKLKNEATHTITFNYNTIIKTYANGNQKIKHTTYDVVKGFSNSRKKSKNTSIEELEYQRYKNLYKSKQNLIDLAFHNSMITPWEYFFTLEFNSNEIDYKNYNLVSQLLSKFLDNLKHQNPNMRYVIVPELHPKSGGVHFHGLFSDVPNLKLKEARNPHNNRCIYKNGCKIYNITNYKYGYTTASKVKGQEQVSVYISKYMTKALIDLNFKKRYWSSKNLERPNIVYAYFDEEKLQFYIKDKEIKNYIEIEKSNCKSAFYDIVASLHNMYYMKLCMSFKIRYIYNIF